jgi:RHS repeat-associated protein
VIYEYNPLGQLVDKKLHSTNGTNYLQSVDMRYNIRGQLLSINNSARNINADNNDETNDVFGMEILYDKLDNNLGNAQYYTGMISAVKWKAASPANTDERSYKYSYDNLYRLTSATYQAKTGSSWTKDQNGFNETLSYDENGNIKTLLRKSVISGTVTTIDDLTYTYKNSDFNNQLENITDAVSTNATGYGYRNFTNTNSSTPYSYDDNGNLIGDLKKGTTITYNELNKPTLIQISSTKKVEYRYDAAGTRISKYVYNNSSTVTKSIEYIGGYVIENDILSYYSMAEGRVRNEGGGFGLSMKMEYFITDQQGNTRVCFEDNNGTVALIQENSYYAFGMQMAGSYMPTNPNKKLYNAGSEWQDDIDGLADYYSTFFREYDPIIGRFNGVDPMAEATDEITTYAYANNNPVMMNDPLGDAATYTTEDMIREMREEYRAWHDPQYGDNSSRYTVDRVMAMWGWGDWSGDGNGTGGGGGGMSEFEFYGSYAGMKIRLSNDPRAQYETNEWGEFGYWLRDRSYFENDGSKIYEDGHLAMQTYNTAVMVPDKWVSLSGSDGSPWFWKRLWHAYQRFDRWVGEHGGDWINENINPVTPFAELITGKQFKQGNFTTNKPRLQSLTEAVIVLIPGGKLVGTGEKLFIKGVGNISKDYFHRTVKKNILKAAGKFGHLVGDNPEIVVEGEKIVLKGVYKSFKGKTLDVMIL